MQNTYRKTTKIAKRTFRRKIVKNISLILFDSCKRIQTAPQVAPTNLEAQSDVLEPAVASPLLSPTNPKSESTNNIKMSRYFNVNAPILNQYYVPPAQSFNGVQHTYKQQLFIPVEVFSIFNVM